MIATVDVCDLPWRAVPTAFARAPKPGVTPGLRSVELALGAPLGPSVLPKPSPRRLVVVAMWEDEMAVECHRAGSALPQLMADGWHVQLEPVRASGSWPGLDPLPSRRRADEPEGPVVALTLGRLRVRRALAFFRASARAEEQILGAEGLIWATGFGRPPFVGTCSLWRDAAALHAFAYGAAGSAHGHAMADDRGDPFHRVSAFVRFRPRVSVGGLSGANPLAPGWSDVGAGVDLGPVGVNGSGRP